MTQLTRLLHIVCLLCACNMAYAQNTIRSRHRPKPRKVTVTQTPLRKYINQKKKKLQNSKQQKGSVTKLRAKLPHVTLSKNIWNVTLKANMLPMYETA